MRSIVRVTGFLGVAGLLTSIHAAPGPTLLVLNKRDLTLAIVDPATLAVVATAPSGPDPHEVVASPDGRVAFITNYQPGAPADTGHVLTVVDLATRRTSTIGLGGLAAPHGITVAGGKVYFTAEGSKAIGRYDPASRSIDWIMGTGQDRTHMIAVSPDLARIYTTNASSATLSILERRAPAGPGPRRAPGPGGPPGGPPASAAGGLARPDWAITNVPVGQGAEGFDVSPDGREVWTANARDASVSVVDAATMKVVATLDVPFQFANRLKFTVDGRRVFISDLGGNDLIVLDAATRHEVKRIPLGGGAAGLQMDPDGSRVFVSVGSSNAVLVVDTRTLSVTGRIASGGGPDGLAWAPGR